jgi:hypothetical protein
MTPETRNLIKLICAIASVAVVLIAMLILIGTSSGSGITEVPSNTFNPVDPDADGTIAPNETKVQLYFRYLDTDMLSSETRSIQSYSNQRVELAVLRALLAGPSQGSGLSRIIDSQTRVVSVSDEGDTLIVTFSEEFLRKSSNLPDGWGEDAALREEEYLKKRLAVYSVVNTLAGMGNYSHVQILIDFNNTGIGQKVGRSSFGFVEDAQNKNKPLSPLAFNESVTLTAQNTVDAVLRALSAHDWQTAYLFLSAKTESGLNRPLFDSVARSLQQNASKLFSYEVTGEIYGSDGKRAVVFVDLSFELPDGTRISKTSAPVRLRAINEVWLIDHDRLYGLFSEG